MEYNEAASSAIRNRLLRNNSPDFSGGCGRVTSLTRIRFVFPPRTSEHRRFHRLRQHRNRRQEPPSTSISTSAPSSTPSRSAARSSPRSPTRTGRAPANTAAHLTQHAIRLVQRNLTPGGDKNGADINLALDALEMAFTHQHINAYVIVGGDSDFLSLVEKLKQYDKKVFVVGGRAFTSVILQRNCHEFIAYENLSGVRRAAASAASKGGRPVVATGAVADRAGVPDRAARAQDSRRPRGLAADRPAQEHAAAARLDVLGAQLRRVVVSRFRREARAGGPGAAEARRAAA